MNKRTITPLMLALLLGLSSTSYAALPASGVYLNKDGTPVSAAEQTPPQLVSHAMPPQTAAVQNAMALLPHSGAAYVEFRVNEFGQPEDASIRQSSGSVILDEYAVTAVQGWTFKPARQGDRNVSAAVSVPVRFVSTMVALPAAPKTQPMKEVSQKVRTLLDGHAGGLDVPLSVRVTSDGKVEGAEAAPWDGSSLSESDKKALQTYAAKSVQDWIFTPAQNPDGEAIISTATVIVHLQ